MSVLQIVASCWRCLFPLFYLLMSICCFVIYFSDILWEQYLQSVFILNIY